jgi:hypothetical protein
MCILKTTKIVYIGHRVEEKDLSILYPVIKVSKTNPAKIWLANSQLVEIARVVKLVEIARVVKMN